MKTRLMVAVVFLVGCAVGGVSSQLVVPKASAQQAATLTKWEYTCFEENDLDDVASKATRLGGDHWELVNFDHYGNGPMIEACFKRPKM